MSDSAATPTRPRRHSSGSTNTRRRFGGARARIKRALVRLCVCAQAIIADCQCVLGRVLARRGDHTGAAAAFRAAVETARVARMPLLELIAGRELQGHVPGADGGAIIDAACARMGKERAQFARLLAS